MGDGYLRRLLVIGATSVIRRADTNPSATGAWLRSLLATKSKRLTTVAMANSEAARHRFKGGPNARIAWAVMTREETYRAPAMV